MRRTNWREMRTPCAVQAWMYFLSRVIRAPSGCCAVCSVRTCNYECRKICPMNEKPGPALPRRKRQRHSKQVPRNRARSISQRLKSTNDEPRKRRIVARRQSAAGFAERSTNGDRNRAAEMPIGIAIRNSFGVCFHDFRAFFEWDLVVVRISVGGSSAGGGPQIYATVAHPRWRPSAAHPRELIG